MPPAGIEVTPLFVYWQLMRHQRECTKRWWSVMIAILSSSGVLICGMASLIVMLALRH